MEAERERWLTKKFVARAVLVGYAIVGVGLVAALAPHLLMLLAVVAPGIWAIWNA